MASAPTVAIGWVRMDKTAEVAVSREEASIDLPFYESMNRSIIIERLSIIVKIIVKSLVILTAITYVRYHHFKGCT